MARTLFVNPRKRRGLRKARKASKAMRKRGRRTKGVLYRGSGLVLRRNAGITPFVQNPIIMSPNPRRRRRRSNPLQGLTVKNIAIKGLTYGGGAALAVGANTMFLNAMENFWARNGVRFGGAVLAAAFMKGELGAATAGGMLYPMMQELAVKFLGGTAPRATEADLEGLAADLEDVMDDLDESDLSDDDLMMEDDDLMMENDEEDILSDDDDDLL